MITKNFKQLSRMFLLGDGPEMETGNVSPGMLRVTGTDGCPYYLRNNAAEGIVDYMTYTEYGGSHGVTFGSGTTPPTESDYKMEAPISSGLRVTRDLYKTTTTSDKLSVEVHYSVTNTSGSAITISEIACKKNTPCSLTPNIHGTPAILGGTRMTPTLLLDRTVLDSPVTIQAGETADFKYILSVDHPNKSRIVNGIKCVPFETGTDEEIGAMIDAARSGVIDLQEDGGWSTGDKRRISVSPFTFVDTNIAAYSPFIEITSFDDYNNCGCIMQFDFYEFFEESVKLSTRGGATSYADLNSGFPSFVNALPEWLRSRLLTFSVISVTTSGEIETVGGNKLALRSIKELYGSNMPNVRSGLENEGNGIDMLVNINGTRKYNRLIRYANGNTSWNDRNDGGYDNGFTRSLRPYGDNTMYLSGGSFAYYATYGGRICPFGCL